MMNDENSQALAQQCAEYMLNNDKVSQALGLQIDSITNDSVTVSMEVTHDMLNGHETCHGGIIFSLADSAFAFACNARNQAAVAASCNIDFILPVFKGDKLTAVATLLHQGRRTGIYHVTIQNQLSKKIALFKGNSARIKRNVLPDNVATD